ncbi:MAG TPA: hypothetical protein VK084_02800, partial [Chitinophagaceae bacterium]|nr:hypothetical protein [Chitinophagaceae bacterium]
MKRFFIFFIVAIISCGFFTSSSASVKMSQQQSVFNDTSSNLIPIYLQLWHDKISKAQGETDLFDGKKDQLVEVSNDKKMNKEVTHAIYNKVNKMRSDIEHASSDRRHKIFYLNSIYKMLQHYNSARREGLLQPQDAIVLVDNFSKMLHAARNGKSIAPYVKNVSYEVASINVTQFSQNFGYNKARLALLRLYAKEHPEDFLRTLNQNYSDLVDAPFIDSVVASIAVNYPVKVYNFASSYTVLGRKIRKNPDSLVQTIVAIGSSGKAIQLLPFVDYINRGEYSISKLKKLSKNQDDFYSLSVKTLIDMNMRTLKGESPVGVKDMEFNVKNRSLRYVRMVNELHESPDRIRFAAAEELTPQEIYYVLVNSQEEIYTSSFVGLYHRLLERMKPESGEHLLMSVVLDRFRKFITLSAAYNTLDPFLSTMETSKASLLMRKFVSGLQNTKGLANAVDVADAFGSIDDSVLLDNLQQQVNLNFQKMKAKNNERGKVIYGLLATLFNTRNSHSAAGDWADQMSEKLNLPPLDYIPYEELTNAEGHIYEEVFFYGDKDGFASYRSFMSSFNNSANWDITSRKYWVEINSSRGKPITIFAKKPMATEDEEGMRALQQYLKENDINPSIFIHRGHSYHAQAS